MAVNRCDNRCDNRWTVSQVEERIEEAVDTLRRLPEKQLQIVRSSWPKFLQDCDDACDTEPAPLRRGPPVSAAIDRMDETLEWLRWLPAEDAKLVWARAEGTTWKVLSWRFGYSERTAQRRCEYALSQTSWRLNGRALPKVWSRQFLIDKVAGLSSQNFA